MVTAPYSRQSSWSTISSPARDERYERINLHTPTSNDAREAGVGACRDETTPLDTFLRQENANHGTRRLASSWRRSRSSSEVNLDTSTWSVTHTTRSSIVSLRRIKDQYARVKEGARSAFARIKSVCENLKRDAMHQR